MLILALGGVGGYLYFTKYKGKKPQKETVDPDADYTEDECLDFLVDFNRNGIEKIGVTQTGNERTKVKLSGQEYTRAAIVTDYYGKMNSYFYARKLDDNLMCIINISMPPEKNIADYEKLFE